jgi:hypothetical protein
MTEATQAVFTITVTGIRTANVGELASVVKHVEWTLEGTQDGQTFALPQKTTMGEPDAEDFIPLASLTPEVVVAWIEAAHETMPAIKEHIQSVLTKMVFEAALEPASLPWAEPEGSSEPENP